MHIHAVNTLFSNPTDSTGISEGDLPALPAWSRDQPNYIVFGKDGATVASDYKQTYNNYMLEVYGPDEGTTTTEGGFVGPSSTTEGEGEGGSSTESTTSTTQEGEGGSNTTTDGASGVVLSSLMLPSLLLAKAFM